MPRLPPIKLGIAVLYKKVIYVPDDGDLCLYLKKDINYLKMWVKGHRGLTYEEHFKILIFQPLEKRR